MKVLLLNNTYQPISFISQNDALKKWSKGKVEILSSWEGNAIHWINGKISALAVVRMRYKVKFMERTAKFSRHAIFRRDSFCCVYCGCAGSRSNLTIDHVIPRSKGGLNNWTNCVTSCYSCNNKKGDKTLEEASLKLLKKPKVPRISIHIDLYDIIERHPDWNFFLGIK